jgi:hypothetical protein
MAIIIKKKPNPYSAHLTSNNVVGTTTHTSIKNHGGGVKDEKLVSSKQETIGMLTVPKNQMHTVEVGGGMTLNLGNFESARLDVRLSVPTTKEDLEAAYDWASDWVSEKLVQASKAAKGE